MSNIRFNQAYEYEVYSMPEVTCNKCGYTFNVDSHKCFIDPDTPAKVAFSSNPLEVFPNTSCCCPKCSEVVKLSEYFTLDEICSILGV